jgi:hypothetical protein
LNIGSERCVTGMHLRAHEIGRSGRDGKRLNARTGATREKQKGGRTPSLLQLARGLHLTPTIRARPDRMAAAPLGVGHIPSPPLSLALRGGDRDSA